MNIILDKELVKKYDVSGPRYTSYPTAPQWTEDVDQEVYIEKLKSFSQTNKTLSLYIHIPFCQTLCSYCGCNVVIRRQEDRFGDEYLDYLSKEVDLITQHIGTKKVVKQFHWGGGTPTYLNINQIERLFEKVNESFDIDKNGEIAIEIDPRTITKDRVKKLRELGFNRISLGVQDFNKDVQESINRVQPVEMVEEAVSWCREFGFESINFDLIYGLPNQTKDSFKKTIDKVAQLKPDRIALYSFAYVPWLKKHQNKMDKDKFPSQDEKLEIFLNARENLFNSGYSAIAMDHFALKDDEMAHAYEENRLYRNFMGYTVKPADEYIGLGVTSIGFLESSFFQNVKALPKYYEMLNEGVLPVERGLVLSEDDKVRQWTINSFMCHFKVDNQDFLDRFKVEFSDYFDQEKEHIYKCINDELISATPEGYVVTELGKIFIRNICMGFDRYLQQGKNTAGYSRTI